MPKRVEGLTNVTDIAAGGFHSLAVGEGGAVYTWGYNNDGQLGLGDHGGGTHRDVPTEVQGVIGVVAVAAGSLHSLALSRDGTVMACGANDDGHLGLGDTVQRDTFTLVAGLRDAVDIDAGRGDGRGLSAPRFHTIAATAEGGLYTWGKGQAMGHGGDGDTQRLVPTKVTGGGIDEAAVVQVAAGDKFSMALTASGELCAWGEGEYGQLGHGNEENLAVPRVVDGIEGAVVGMSGGMDHSLVTTAEGRVLAFGDGGFGQLGLGAGGEGMTRGSGSGLGALTPTAIDGITMGEGGEGKEGKE